MTYAAKEAAWLHCLLYQVGYIAADTHPIHLYGDNEPSIKLLTADGHHERTKHVDIYYHYIKNCVKDGHLTVSQVRTHEMAADSLTKPLDCQCKRLDLCWPQWVHFGSQKYHRTSWNSMESHGTSWNPTEPHGISQNLMESHRTSWNLTEPHEIPQNLMESHGRFWNMAESSGC
jgi:hypothetical protein